jgi:hypothetical protein
VLGGGIDVIPAREFAATDEQMAEWALVENDQRRNLTLWEQTKATLQVRDLLMCMGRKHSQEDVAEALGASKGTVNTRLSIADQITERVLESAGYVDLPADQAPEGRRGIYDVPQNALRALAKIKDEDRRVQKLKAHLSSKRVDLARSRRSPSGRMRKVSFVRSRLARRSRHPQKTKSSLCTSRRPSSWRRFKTVLRGCRVAVAFFGTSMLRKRYWHFSPRVRLSWLRRRLEGQMSA